MTAQEWMIHRHEDPNKLEELAIWRKFLHEVVCMTESERQMLEKNIRHGKQRQWIVARLVRLQTRCKMVIIKDEVWWLLDLEPYSVDLFWE